MPDSSDASLNADLSKPCRVDSNTLEWTASPSGTVSRRRMHLVGAAEAGQVTSIVRYEPGARFPAHDHPEGEEILVLEGVFSDEHGDWPEGTFLLNPEGFRHAPFSEEGCVLWVKLRQFPGTEREHVALDHTELRWQATGGEGIEQKTLYAQPGFSDVSALERWAPGTRPATRSYELGAEYFVLDGSFEDEHGEHGPRTWLRLPMGSRHTPRTASGCTLYVKRGGLPYLRSA